MGRFYVDITGIPQNYLDFLGYTLFAEDESFKILRNKSDMHLVDKEKPYLFVDDMNDAEIMRSFGGRAKIPVPLPKGTKEN
jgi:hypothetical protein